MPEEILNPPLDESLLLSEVQGSSFDRLRGLSPKDVWYQLTAETQRDSRLREHRDWVEENKFGFGDRPLHAMWGHLLHALPEDPRLLEVGVYMGQVLSLWRVLLPASTIWGITPLTGTDDGLHKFKDLDYRAKISEIHDHFHLKHPLLIARSSTHPLAIYPVSGHRWDLIYIDGGHDTETITSDLRHYPFYLAPGGYLVVDDCNFFSQIEFEEPGEGKMWFPGFDSVSGATDEFQKNHPEFKTILNVGHVRVMRRDEVSRQDQNNQTTPDGLAR